MLYLQLLIQYKSELIWRSDWNIVCIEGNGAPKMLQSCKSLFIVPLFPDKSSKDERPLVSPLTTLIMSHLSSVGNILLTKQVTTCDNIDNRWPVNVNCRGGSLKLENNISQTGFFLVLSEPIITKSKKLPSVVLIDFTKRTFYGLQQLMR